MGIDPAIITASSLSAAWADAFLQARAAPRGELSPLVVTVTGFTDGLVEETPEIRTRLDAELARHGAHAIQTVANTIFPDHLWYSHRSDAADLLFASYERIWPRVRKNRENRRGVYFRRLTAYQPKVEGAPVVNQLREILTTYRAGNHRRSALQAAIFDPTRDHTKTRQLGFPCLQQVAFMPYGDRSLAVTGFYPKQLVFERAYGNYLGLARLSRFMAAEMGLCLERLCCVTVVAEHAEEPKNHFTPFAADLQALRSSQAGL